MVIKEESGLRSFYHALLLPFVHYIPFWVQRPQELLWSLAWGRAHGRDAARIGAAGQALVRRYLGAGALRCYWAQLWMEYAALLRFRPGPPEHGGERSYEDMMQARPTLDC